jgi:hypothetical protein
LVAVSYNSRNSRAGISVEDVSKGYTSYTSKGCTSYTSKGYCKIRD